MCALRQRPQQTAVGCNSAAFLAQKINDTTSLHDVKRWRCTPVVARKLPTTTAVLTTATREYTHILSQSRLGGTPSLWRRERGFVSSIPGVGVRRTLLLPLSRQRRRQSQPHPEPHHSRRATSRLQQGSRDHATEWSGVGHTGRVQGCSSSAACSTAGVHGTPLCRDPPHISEISASLLDAIAFCTAHVISLFVGTAVDCSSGQHPQQRTSAPVIFLPASFDTEPRVHVVERGAVDQVLQSGNRREGLTKIASPRGCMLQDIHGLRASTWAASTSIWRRNHRFVSGAKLLITLSANAQHFLSRPEMFAD